MYNIFNTVIGLSHLCCHNVLYFLSNPSVIFRTQLHSISEYCRILNTPHHLRLYWNWLSTFPSSSSHEGGGIWEGPHNWNSLGPLFITIRHWHHTQANTENANKKRSLPQTTGGNDKPNIVETILTTNNWRQRRTEHRGNDHYHKQPKATTNRTSFPRGNHNAHHTRNSERKDT